MKKPLLCRFGLHRHETFEMDGTPVGPWMVIGRNYIDRCSRCGREKIFNFYIERS